MITQLAGKLMSIPEIDPNSGDLTINGVTRITLTHPKHPLHPEDTETITIELDGDLNEVRVLHDGECYLSV